MDTITIKTDLIFEIRIPGVTKAQRGMLRKIPRKIRNMPRHKFRLTIF